MMAQLRFDGTQLTEAGFRFVRHNDRNETVLCPAGQEPSEFNDIVQRSIAYGTRLTSAGDAVSIEL